MAPKNSLAVLNDKVYLSSFKTLISMIKEFQKLPLTSTMFEFLENISPYEYTPSHKKEIIKHEHPNLYKFGVKYNATLKQLRTQLNEKFKATKPKESKMISADLEKALDRLSNELTEEKVKSKIIAEFTDENRFIEAEHFGIKMQEFKPYIWKDFKPELLNNSYLFEDYFGWLYRMFILIGDVVEEFTTGYKGISKLEINEVDFTKKPKHQLQDFIADRWDSFQMMCMYYSVERIFKSGEDATVINYIKSKEEFHWEGINDSAIPTFAQFINALKQDGFFAFPKRERVIIADCFLKFFHLPTGKEKAKYLLKEMRDTRNLYINYFNTPK